MFRFPTNIYILIIIYNELGHTLMRNILFVNISLGYVSRMNSPLACLIASCYIYSHRVSTKNVALFKTV